MNLKRTLARKKGFMDAEEDGIVKFAEEQFQKTRATRTNWNGRQIRNAFQTAAALAEHDAQDLDHRSGRGPVRGPVYSFLHTKHFKIVAHAAEQFDVNIKSVNGSAADQNLNKSMENDNFQHTRTDSGDKDESSLPNALSDKKAQKARDSPKDYEEQELEQLNHPQPTPSQRSQRRLDPVIDDYENDYLIYSQPQSIPQRRLQPLHTTPAARQRRNHNAPPDNNSYQALGMGSKGRRRVSTPQRPSAARASTRSRQPEPELGPESEEPDYIEEDSEGLE